MHSDLIVFILGSFLQYFLSNVRSTVNVEQGCRSDHVMSLFSEFSDELTVYHDFVLYFENFHVGSCMPCLILHGRHFVNLTVCRWQGTFVLYRSLIWNGVWYCNYGEACDLMHGRRQAGILLGISCACTLSLLHATDHYFDACKQW